MEYLTDRITIDEKICNGKPTIRGKRIAVLNQYPSLTADDIKACLQFATESGQDFQNASDATG